MTYAEQNDLPSKTAFKVLRDKPNVISYNPKYH